MKLSAKRKCQCESSSWNWEYSFGPHIAPSMLIENMVNLSQFFQEMFVISHYIKSCFEFSELIFPPGYEIFFLPSGYFSVDSVKLPIPS